MWLTLGVLSTWSVDLSLYFRSVCVIVPLPVSADFIDLSVSVSFSYLSVFLLRSMSPFIRPLSVAGLPSTFTILRVLHIIRVLQRGQV
jgi:hypothetical protein